MTRLSDDAITVAQRLLGQRLVRVLDDGSRLAGIIVETEAYLGAEDRAAHTFGGRRTLRNESMYRVGGHAYVYFTYGKHFCLNVVCGRKNEGTAVLIRAIEPTEGIELMLKRRPTASNLRSLCAGPGRLAAALEIDRRLDGEDLRTSRRLFIERATPSPLDPSAIIRTARVGLNPDPLRAGAWARKPLRFLVAGSPFVSRGPQRSPPDAGGR